MFLNLDIRLNTKTLGWPAKIRPVFEQNTEIVEDCKAKFEDNLQKKSEWISRELEKLSSRVQELEELGEINSIQQYTYVREPSINDARKNGQIGEGQKASKFVWWFMEDL